jgi:hypothetical protein
MLRMIATGTYIMSLAILVLSFLEIVDFNALAGLILYFILQEVSEFAATAVYARESGGE